MLYSIFRIYNGACSYPYSGDSDEIPLQNLLSLKMPTAFLALPILNHYPPSRSTSFSNVSLPYASSRMSLITALVTCPRLGARIHVSLRLVCLTSCFRGCNIATFRTLMLIAASKLSSFQEREARFEKIRMHWEEHSNQYLFHQSTIASAGPHFSPQELNLFDTCGEL